MTPLVGVILPPWAGLGNPGHLTIKSFMTLDLSAFLIITAVLVDVDNSNFVIIALDTIPLMLVPWRSSELHRFRPLFASGAGLLGFFGWRRKKRSAKTTI